MKYNFDKIVDRRHTGAVKWEIGENELPMWVADMDFQTAPEITQAIVTRAEHGIFGYNETTGEWKNAVIGWWKRQYETELCKDWLVFCTGVIGGILSVIRRFTKEGDGVVIMTPVYNTFFKCVENNGRRVEECPLIYADGKYSIDWELFEVLLAKENTTMMILCNPHNPTGQIWKREELQRIAALCGKYGVLVIADEIHCDLTAPGEKYTPYLSLDAKARENVIVCVSPTKSFNLAGLHTAALVIPNEDIRAKADYGLWMDGIAEPNVFAMTAAIAAYEKGEAWLLELRDYIRENESFACDCLADACSKVKPVKKCATYLLWLDCSEVLKENETSSDFCRFLRDEVGLILTDGTQYRGNGRNFLRMNLAAPRELVADGLKRFANGVEKWLNRR